MFATVSSLWKLSVNYILKSGDFPTFSKFFQCKRWFQEKLFTSIPQESSEHKRPQKLLAGILLFLDFLWSSSKGRPVSALGGKVLWPNEAAASPQTWFSYLRLTEVLFNGWAGLWTQVFFHTIPRLLHLYHFQFCLLMWLSKFDKIYEFLAVTVKTRLSKAVEPPSTF